MGVISLTIGHHQRDFRIPFQQLLRKIMAQTFSYTMPVHASFGKGLKVSNRVICTKYETSANFAQVSYFVLFEFFVTVKAAPHECVIRTGKP